MRARGVVTRTAWLMLGAAIGLAAVLLAVGLAQLVVGVLAVPEAVIITVLLLLVPLLALVPGVRELEVTAARSMLRVESGLVESSVRPEHRRRIAGWVVAHLASGLLAGFLLLGVAPGGVAVSVSVLSGADDLLARVGLPQPASPAGRAVTVLLAVGAVAGCLVAVWAIGLLARRLAPIFLGPTTADRLALAEARLASEVEHTRLARELHDGIGHALTLISVQATAGRRLAGEDPRRATAALEVIETVARQALTELDAMLGVLREEAAAPAPEPDLARLPDLVEVHRRNGMQVSVDADPVERLPPLVSRSVYRIVAEGLTNAQRYAGPGPVTVRIRRLAGELELEVTNPLPERSHVADGRTGYGLQGVAERVRVLGGWIEIGPVAGRWQLRAVLPVGDGRGRI